MTDPGLAERHRQLERTPPVHDDRTAEGLRDEVAPRVLGVGAGRSESRDRHHRQRAATAEQIVAVDAPVGEAAESGRLDDEVDTVEELRERCHGRGCDLDDGAALVGVEVDEHPRVGAERVTVGWLDLDHVGAEVGEDLAAPPRRNTGPDLDDPQIAQCLTHDVPSAFTPPRRTRPGCRWAPGVRGR